ncbi:MAG: sarcosine oxidase subunit delta [Sneathiellaceae bacterium]
MRIPCPVCGARSVGEFTYGGDAGVVRPDLEASAEAWQAAVYARDNPRGAHREYWQHSGGCRAWLLLERDTLTHAIAGARLVGPWSGCGAGGAEEKAS